MSKEITNTNPIHTTVPDPIGVGEPPFKPFFKPPKPRSEKDIKDCILSKTKELNIIADLNTALSAFLMSEEFDIEFEDENVFYTILGKLEILMLRRKETIKYEVELLEKL